MARFCSGFLYAIAVWLASVPPALAAGGQEPSASPPPAGQGEPLHIIPLGGDGSRIVPQKPLAPEGEGCAVIFIGGMGDEVTGIMDWVADCTPAVLPRQKETRAYYHWHADVADQDPMAAARYIAGHVAAFRRHNPGADVIILGHSLGGGTALKVARAIPQGQGGVYLLTLDPIDRTTKPERPASLTWWGNAYVCNSQSGNDAFFALGGRWGRCSGADLNLCFDGRDTDEAGRPYIHDDARALLMSRGAAAPAPSSPRPGRSLMDALRQRLRGE